MQSTKSCLDAQAMINLIYNAYQINKAWTHDSVVINHETITGAFAKMDELACIDCKRKDPEKGTKVCTDEIVAKYDAGDKTVHFINIEQFLNSIKNREAAKCDFLFYTGDYDKVVFNELTCGEQVYVLDDKNKKGKLHKPKRQKAREQLKCVIEELLSMPETKEELDKFTNCIALFSYRIKDLEQIPADKKDPIGSMGGFIQATILTNSLRATENLTDRFVWEERRYPEVFNF